MKRCPELVVLSREHHAALELALRLQRATEADAEAVQRAAVEFWDRDGQQHFRRAQAELDPQQLAAIGRERPRGINVDDLERWTEAGATLRLYEMSEDLVVIDMCQCTGELVERRSSADPAVLAYVRDAHHADRSTDEPTGTSLSASSTGNES
jgi:hypothetical protein